MVNVTEKSFKEMQDNICPFITKRHEDCYGTNLNSQTIAATLFYCGRSFESCTTYEKLSMEKERSNEESE